MRAQTLAGRRHNFAGSHTTRRPRVVHHCLKSSGGFFGEQRSRSVQHITHRNLLSGMVFRHRGYLTLFICSVCWKFMNKNFIGVQTNNRCGHVWPSYNSIYESEAIKPLRPLKYRNDTRTSHIRTHALLIFSHPDISSTISFHLLRKAVLWHRRQCLFEGRCATSETAQTVCMCIKKI